MGLLARTLLIASLASACYEPEVRDCSVKCSALTDCAGGQLCGNEGYCVDNTSVRCGDSPSTLIDAGVAPTDGHGDGPVDAHVDAPPPPPDAAPTPDAPTHGTVNVDVDGKGGVFILGLGWCTDHCTYTVLLGTPITAHAQAGDDFRFDKWTTNACPDEHDPDCPVTVTSTVSLGAKFRKDKH
jgi:hypothetical protein